MTRPLCLLDLDGTLMDSLPAIAASVTRAYRAIGVPAPTGAVLRSFAGPPITSSFAAHGVPPELLGAAVDAYRDGYEERMMTDTRVFDGIPAVLAGLRAGGLTLAVATSKPEVYARPVCAQFGLADLVDGVFGAPLDESTSSKAQVIARALAAFPGSDRALMVGDREHDVLGARAHGVDTVGVTWGYAAPGELASAAAVELVGEVSELTGVVLRRLRAGRAARS